MSISVIGINHKTAPVTLREKIFFAQDRLSLYLQDLLSHGYAGEAVLLSTCNRSELYCETDDISHVRDWFCAQTALPRQEVESALYIYRNQEAVEHIMEVACGLDSMILGEPEIFGQMKAAFSESCTLGVVGPSFNRLFQQIFKVAKEIRSATAIGACPVSVASAAVHLVKQKVPSFAGMDVMLVGAGDTVELIMRYLASHLTKPVTLVNRSLDKATALIGERGGHVYGLDRLATAMAKADVVFTATGSALPIITTEIAEEAMRSRAGRPLLLMDIAVPRDIDSAVAEIPGVELHCIDDLKAIIEGNRQGREHAAIKAREMIYTKSAEYIREAANYDDVANTIRACRGQIESLCHTELNKAKQRLHNGEEPDQVLEIFARNFTNKLLHTPSVQLRQAGVEGRFELLRFAKELFSITDPEVELL